MIEMWVVYLVKLKKLIDNIVVEYVMVVLNFFGNDVGVFVGRLCYSVIFIVDIFVWVKMGVFYGLGLILLFKDKDDVILIMVYLK